MRTDRLFGTKFSLVSHKRAALFKKVKVKIKVKRNDKTELAPNEEYEWETPYQIDNFSDPVYMYFMTSENSINEKWRYETIVVIPETGSVNFLVGKK